MKKTYLYIALLMGASTLFHRAPTSWTENR